MNIKISRTDEVSQVRYHGPARMYGTRPGRQPATRQARYGHHATRTQTRAAPSGQRRRARSAQLPRPAPSPPACTRPARTRTRRPAPATSAAATTATRTHPLAPRRCKAQRAGDTAFFRAASSRGSAAGVPCSPASRDPITARPRAPARHRHAGRASAPAVAGWQIGASGKKNLAGTADGQVGGRAGYRQRRPLPTRRWQGLAFERFRIHDFDYRGKRYFYSL